MLFTDTLNMQPPRYIVRPHEMRGLHDSRPMPTIVHLQDASTKRLKYTSQILATLAVSLGPLAAGLAKGYSSPAIDSLQNNTRSSAATSPSPSSSHRTSSWYESNLSSVYASVKPNGFPTVKPTDQEVSWIASLSLLGAVFGALFGGLAMKFGRRNVLLCTSVPLFISWIMTHLAVNVPMMYAASFIGGFCSAIILTVTQVYISEISDPQIRGCQSGVLKIFNQIGLLISFVVGSYLDWRQLALVVSVAPILFFFAIFSLPETPSYLILINRYDEAAKSLHWLRGGDDYDVHKELLTIQGNVARSRRRQNGPHSSLRDMADQLWHPVLITCCLLFFHRFSGVNAFTFYSVTILRRVFSVMNPHCGAIAVGSVQLLASLLSGVLIDKVGRLPLLITSTMFMSIALAAFGSYVYFVSLQPTGADQFDSIALLCVLVFTVAYSLGISPISMLLVGELFPLEYRGLGSALAMSFSYACAFLNVKTFTDFSDAFGLHGAFWLYSAFGVAGLCFVVCCVPETRGADLQEMEDNFLRA